MQNNWFVITGGPSSGKTATMDLLAIRGYKTVPEAARVYIEAGMAKGRTVEQIRADEEQFQYDILGAKANIESKLNPQDIVILDRGMYDTISYLECNGFSISAEIKEIINRAWYRTVFIFEQLPVYEVDHVRTESSEHAKKIEQGLRAAYKAAGLKVIEIPPLSIQERADLVESYIKQSTQG